MNARTYLLAIIGMAMIVFAAEASAVCYVDQNAKGKNDGSSWANAHVHPQLALETGCTEIWVAKGVYTPAWLGSDPSISFDIPAGTKMYGGFAGGETTVDQRLPSLNRTVLSGDVDHNDVESGSWMSHDPRNIRGVNSHHIVTMYGTSTLPIGSSTVLDGFLITGGYSQLTDDIDGGGGLVCSGSDASIECSPTLNDLVFVGNQADDFGGAIAFLSAGNPIISNTALVQNWAGTATSPYGEGGAIYSATSVGAQVFANCAFFHNVAYKGGAIKTFGATRVINTTFLENTSSFGGAVYFGREFFASVPTPQFINTTFSNNGAVKGGAIYLQNSNASSDDALLITNTIFWGNTANGGADIFNESQGHNFEYIDHSVIKQGCPNARSVCLDVSQGDPRLFTLAADDGTTVLVPGVDGSAIDRGDDTTCNKLARSDQRGVPRPQGVHCDIGAIEWQPSDDVIFSNGFL